MIEAEKMISLGNQCRLEYLNGLDQFIREDDSLMGGT